MLDTVIFPMFLFFIFVISSAIPIQLFRADSSMTFMSIVSHSDILGRIINNKNIILFMSWIVSSFWMQYYLFFCFNNAIPSWNFSPSNSACLIRLRRVVSDGYFDTSGEDVLNKNLDIVVCGSCFKISK